MMSRRMTLVVFSLCVTAASAAVQTLPADPPSRFRLRPARAPDAAPIDAPRHVCDEWPLASMMWRTEGELDECRRLGNPWRAQRVVADLLDLDAPSSIRDAARDLVLAVYELDRRLEAEEASVRPAGGGWSRDPLLSRRGVAAALAFARLARRCELARDAPCTVARYTDAIAVLPREPSALATNAAGVDRDGCLPTSADAETDWRWARAWILAAQGRVYSTMNGGAPVAESFARLAYEMHPMTPEALLTLVGDGATHRSDDAKREVLDRWLRDDTVQRVVELARVQGRTLMDAVLNEEDVRRGVAWRGSGSESESESGPGSEHSESTVPTSRARPRPIVRALHSGSLVALPLWTRQVLAELLLWNGVLLFRKGDLERSIPWFGAAEALSAHVLSAARADLGAAYHLLALHVEAKHWYRAALAHGPFQFSGLNNLAAIHVVSAKVPGSLDALRRVFEVDPTSANSHLNLADLYLSRSAAGDEDRARHCNVAAYNLTGSIAALLRAAMVLPVIPESREHIRAVRARFADEVGAVAALRGKGLVTALANPSSDLERTPFYLTYHGEDDRALLEAFADACRPDPVAIAEGLVQSQTRQEAAVNAAVDDPTTRARLLHALASNGATHAARMDEAVAHVLRLDPVLARGGRRVRVGFISMFFTMNHAHGQLLRGIIAGLDRRFFHVVVIRIPAGSLIPNPEVLEAADEVVEVPLHMRGAIERLAPMGLDVLVYADQLSEMSSFGLSFARLAPVQVAFWGNPTTSGHRDSVDYFVSGDRMESNDERQGWQLYTEQVVRLGGQGIWYDPIPVPATAAAAIASPTAKQALRVRFGFPADARVYGCPQSAFKFTPSTDDVFAAVLRADPTARFLVLEDRLGSWTRNLRARWNRTMPDVMDRMHWFGRQPNSNAFMELVACVDVMLHPFPFDGSKTAADAIALHIPLVTLPTHFLRGRMGRALLLTVGLDATIARNPAHYVRLAVALGQNETLRSAVRAHLEQASSTIWQRREVVLQWQSFLLGAVGYDVRVRRWARRQLETENAWVSSRDARLQQSVHRAFVADALRRVNDGPPSLEERQAWGESLATRLWDEGAVLAGHDASDLAWEIDPCHDETDRTLCGLSPSEFGVMELDGERVWGRDSAVRHAAEALEALGAGACGRWLAEAAPPVSEQPAWTLPMCGSGEGTALDSDGVLAFVRGTCRVARGDLAGGSEDLERAAAILPVVPVVWNNLGIALTEQGRSSDATACFQRALALRPTDPSALFNIALTLERRDRPLEALRELQASSDLPSSGRGLEQVLCLATVAGPRDGEAEEAHLARLDAALASLSIDWDASRCAVSRNQQDGQDASAASTSSATWAQESTVAWTPTRCLAHRISVFRRDLLPASALVSLLSRTTPHFDADCGGLFETASRVVRASHPNPLVRAGQCAVASKPPPPGALGSLHLDDADTNAGAGVPKPLLFRSPLLVPSPVVDEEADRRAPVRMHVVTQWYSAPSPLRREELRVSLLGNARNPRVARVHLLLEAPLDETVRAFLAEHGVLDRVLEVVVGARLTFAAAFAYAHAHLAGSLVAIANADVFLDAAAPAEDAWNCLLSSLADDEVWALSRRDVQEPAGVVLRKLLASEHIETRFRARVDAQDAWLFRSPVPALVHRDPQWSVDAAFALGQLRCDGRLAALLHAYGVRVRNFALFVPWLHLHGVREPDNGSIRANVPGAAALLPLEVEPPAPCGCAHVTIG